MGGRGSDNGAAVKLVPVSQIDLETWGLILDGYPGATGSRPSEYLSDPLIAGGLWTVIPISETQLAILLSCMPIVRGAPGNAWDRIGEFTKFHVSLDAWRLKVGWFAKYWAVRVGFIFGEGRDALWVQNVKWYSAADLPAAFGVFNQALKRGRKLPDLPPEISTDLLM